MKRNKLIFLIGVFASVVAWADDVDFLDKQINELSARRDELLEEYPWI